MAESDFTSSLKLIGKYFTEILKNEKEWIMKCKLCSCKRRLIPGVTSNFHRHLRVSD